MATSHMLSKGLASVFPIILATCPAIYCQQTRADQSASPRVRDVVGIYEGSYTCSQGNTRFRVEIRSDDDRVLTAVATFFLPAGATLPTSSYSFRLQGPLNANAETQLTPRAWETTPPAGWTMVGMAGRFDIKAGTFSGRMQGPGCTTFNVSRAASQTLTTGGAQTSPSQQSARVVGGGQVGTAAAQAAPGARPSTPQPASGSEPQRPTDATQTTSAAQEQGSEPLVQALANCETDNVLMHFYDCACYARRTIELLNQSGVVRPPTYVPDGPPTGGKASDPKFVEYHAALGRYNAAYGKAREGAAATTTCISTSAISKWAHQQVNALGRSLVSGDCVAEAVIRQYQQNPIPNNTHVWNLFNEAAGACQR